MNGPPGMPIQSMPAGWLKKISWCEEQIKALQKRVAELEAAARAPIVQPAPSSPVTIEVRRGPGRPRKQPVA